MPRPPQWYIKKIELFADLTDAEIDELLQGIQHVQYPAKHLLYEPGERVEDTYILKEGEVTLYQMNDERRVVLDILKPGAVFGNIGFDPDIDAGVYAETSQQAFICILPRTFFLRLLQKHPRIALRAFQILQKRISQYQSQLQFFSLLSARDRILTTIRLLNLKEDESILPAILRRPTQITHEKLANMTGLTRETVTKQLQTLAAEDLLHIEKKHIRLTEQGQQSIQRLA